MVKATDLNPVNSSRCEGNKDPLSVFCGSAGSNPAGVAPFFSTFLCFYLFYSIFYYLCAYFVFMDEEKFLLFILFILRRSCK